jgi:pilus assembly protein CpaD
MLAGCYTTQTVPSGLANDYRLRHPIAIKEGVHTTVLFVGSRRGGLSPDQRADVLAFANSWRREATGGIVIDLPAGTHNEIAAANAAHEVRSILSAVGVPLQAVDVRSYRTADPGKLGTVRLSYPTMTAEAGPCGLWPHDLGPTADREHNENVPFYNLGCATQRNFAAMVDNKADLVQPRGEVPPYTGRRTTVLDKYHRGESSATTYPDSDKAKISDVGK